MERYFGRVTFFILPLIVSSILIVGCDSNNSPSGPIEDLNVSGVWRFLNNAGIAANARLIQDKNTITGDFFDPMSITVGAIAGTIEGNRISFTVDWPDSTEETVFKGRIRDNTYMNGSYVIRDDDDEISHG